MIHRLLFAAIIAAITIQSAGCQVNQYTANTIRALQKLQVKGVTVDSISTDGDLSAASNTKLLTALAAKTYSSTHLGGRSLSTSAPTTGETLVWNGAQWVPDSIATGSSGGGIYGVSDTVTNGHIALVADELRFRVPYITGANENFLTVEGTTLLGGAYTDAYLRFGEWGAVDDEYLFHIGGQYLGALIEPGQYLKINLGGDADGDLYYRAAGEVARVPIGTTGQVLTSDGTGPYWATPSGGATNLTYSGASSPVTLNSSTGTDVTITASTGISLSASSSNLTITNTGDTNAADDLTTSTSFSGDVSGLWNNLQIGAGTVGTNEVANGSLTATDLAVNVVSSIENVTNDGGNIDLVAGAGITITGDDAANTITITATGGSVHRFTLSAIDYNVTWTTGRTRAFFTVPAWLSGKTLSKAIIEVSTIGASSTVEIERGGVAQATQTITQATHEVSISQTLNSGDIWTFDVTSAGSARGLNITLEINL